MRSNVHVIFVSRYDFQDQKTGNRVRGMKVTYLGDAQDEPNSKGLPSCTVSAPIELWDKFGQLPGNYNVDFKQKPNGKSVELVVTDASFVPKAA